jgi:hypothetical protein
MGIKLSNNANATLAASITSSSTSITVTSGQGARFPTLSAGDYFYATLIDTSNNLEIVKCTARSTDVLTVVRAQESTTARAYTTGDRIEIRLTAQTFLDATYVAPVTAATVCDQVNSSTGYFDLPAGTTAQRPGSPANGMIRYNTDSNKLEFYNSATGTWSSVGGVVATGGTITNVDGYTIHTFTSSGTFQVTAGSGTVELLVVGGGAQGAANDGTANESGGGGGAGGLVYVAAYPVSAGSYSVTIGAGGSGSTGSGSDARNGVQGSDSVFGAFTALGGGYGGEELGGNGGSGGGSGRSNTGRSSSVQNSTVNGYVGVGFGFGGGSAGGNVSRSAGGGGGAGAVGGDAGSSTAGAGGVGKQYSVSGTATYYAGGGGGGGAGGVTRGLGGNGGGGNGGQDAAGSAGTANRGGGGGGSSAGNTRGGNGGSGVVILRYIP